MQKIEQNRLISRRNSSIELLKIVGIILIVISHVVQTLHSNNDYVIENDYILDISTATTSIQQLILTILRYSGSLGNSIFFICSAWFLLDNDKVDKKKILHMLMNVWVISITILIAVYIIRGGNLQIKLIIKQILPTTFENNWYITCYLLFYPLHPFLNRLIKSMEQKILLKSTLVLLFLYVGVNYILSGRFFSSPQIASSSWTPSGRKIGSILATVLVEASDSTKIGAAAAAQAAQTMSRNASKSSSGVQYPRFFLGRLLRASAAQRISSSEKFSMEIPLGTYRRSNPL